MSFLRMRPDIRTILQLTSGYRFPEFFQSLKVFLSMFFPGRVESYIVESYVIDTADDIVFGYMNNSVFMLSRVAFSMSIHMAVSTLSC